MTYRSRRDIYHPKIIDIFCGCGGLSFGFHQHNYDIVMTAESDKTSLLSYKANYPGAVQTFCNNPYIIDYDKYQNKIDVVLFSPPNLLLKTKATEYKGVIPDGQLLLKIVNKIKPTLTLVTLNTWHYSQRSNSNFVNEILNPLHEMKYKTEFIAMPLPEFGIPQRKNCFFLAIFLSDFKFPAPRPTHSSYTTFYTKKFVRPKDILPQDPLPDIKGEDLNVYFDPSISSLIRGTVIDLNLYIPRIYPQAADLPIFDPDQILSSSKYSWVIDNNIIEGVRKLNLAEVAAAQSLPRSFLEKMKGTYKSKLKQITTTTPPTISMYLANMFKSKLFDMKRSLIK